MNNSTTPSAPQKSNIRKLAELIYDTGNADCIMAALEIILRAGLADDLRAAGAKESEV